MILSFFCSRRNAFLLLFVLFSITAFGQNIKICSWNLKNFGKSKTDEQITFIANTVRDFDVLAIQEVVAGPGGPQAVARLADELNRKGEKWEYAISQVTSGETYSRERYAFLWKSSKLKNIGAAWLEQKYHVEIDREPYLARFRAGKKTFTLGNFHAVPKAKQPETEIKYFKFMPDIYPDDTLIFCGDFNLPQSHTVFNPLRSMGYVPAMVKQKTSLKQKCINDNCLASEYDNFFFPLNKVKLLKTGIVHFYTSFEDLKDARRLSDHVPVFMEFTLN